MQSGKYLRRILAAAALLSIGQAAVAAYTINVTEVGGNVVASGSGSINTAALALFSGSSTKPLVRGGQALLYIGGTPHVFSPMAMSGNGTISGPTSFGTPLVDTDPDSASGGLAGVIGHAGRLFVPPGYVSQSPMASSATWNGKTIAGLGLTPGTYTWTWGAGPTADSFTVQIGPLPAAPASIPTLSEWGLIGLSSILAMFGIARMRQRKA